MGTYYLRDVVKPSRLLNADLISQAYVIMAEKAESLGIDFTAQTNLFMTKEFLRQTYVTVSLIYPHYTESPSTKDWKPSLIRSMMEVRGSQTSLSQRLLGSKDKPAISPAGDSVAKHIVRALSSERVTL
eukprot:scaffold153519_cov52-Prasinocladus_malaysianus.AAC.1